MQPTLPLEGAPPPVPFTRSQALARGTSRAALDRLVADGSVRRLLRGVYVAAAAPDSTALRATAVALVVPRGGIVVDRTAAWVHGVDVGEEPVPLDVVTSVRPGPVSRGGSRRLAGRDLTCRDGVRLTTALRTALDLGRVLAPGPALAAMDALMRLDGFCHAALLAELSRFGSHRGVAQLRSLAAQVDPRATCAAESVLRLRWHSASLPTATPGAVVPAGHRLVRLALGVEGRRFGVALAGRTPAADLVALEGAGWRVALLGEGRVLGADPALLVGHLQREFHQYLLAEAEGW